MDYKTTIGLEVHAELKTKTKMFCNSKNNTDEKKPNVNICPICLGHPGTLPTINKEAVKHIVKVGMAVGGEIAKDFTEFDRKNYFYPDIPKGYQISQYQFPLVKGGQIAGVELTRIHLEEDTARSVHNGKNSLVDFNRAGIPLMELVTEPVIKNAKQALDFAKELQLLLQYLGVAEANMEKGEMRVEANVSVSDSDKLGTKVEIKNLNSFRAVERAIEFEVERHKEMLSSGQKIIQETRGWNEAKQETFSQREKEESHDYRYFPDPDLPKIKLGDLDEFDFDLIKKELPELPWEKREKYLRYGINLEDAEMYVRDKIFGEFFSKVAEKFSDPQKIKLASNYLSSDIAGLNAETPVYPWLQETESHQKIVDLVEMIYQGKISSRGAKNILKMMIESGGSPEDIAEKENLFQQSDEGEIKKMAEKIVEGNKDVSDEYRAGKESALQYLIGQGMKVSKGSVNPETLKNILVELLK